MISGRSLDGKFAPAAQMDLLRACRKCEALKPIALFGRHKRICKKCESDRTNAWNKAHRDIVRRNLMKARCKRFGITVDEYQRMLVAQDFCCPICQTDVPGGQGTWHIDHDHRTGRVRGLLCCNCNSMLGHAKDDPQTLAAAIEYLGGRLFANAA